MNPNRDIKWQKYIEGDVAWNIGLRTGRGCIQMPEFCSADFVIFDAKKQEMTALGELRQRQDTSRTQYSELVMTKSKLDKVEKAAELLSVQPILFVLWLEPILWWTPITTKRWKVREGFERKDQERVNDKPEDVYLIPTSGFKRFMDYEPPKKGG